MQATSKIYTTLKPITLQSGRLVTFHNLPAETIDLLIERGIIELVDSGTSPATENTTQKDEAE